MMKRIKKFVSTLIVMSLGLCTVLCLSGCHGTKGLAAFEIPEEFDTSRNYEVTFWAKNDTNKVQTNVYKNAIAEFEKLYPNITVNMRLYTDYGKIYNDVITNISTNTTPNVCITYPDHIATYMTGINIMVPLDDLMANSKYGLGGAEVKFDSPRKDEIVPDFLDECAFKEHYYALPYMRSTEACYINKDMVEALGYEVPDILTWDFVWEVSEKAMEKDSSGNYKINGQNVLIPFIYKSTDNMMISMMFQKGAEYSDEEGHVYMFNDDAKDILLSVAPHAKSGAFSTFKISSYPGNFLNAGQCIFAVDSTAGATWMGSDAPLSDICMDDITQFETVVRPIPQYDPANPKMISQGPSVCIFNKEDPQEVLASWLFTQYLLTNEVQIGYSQTEGYVPVTLKAQNSPEYLDYLSRSGEDNDTYYSVKIDAAKLLLANTSNTFTAPVFNGSASLRNASEQMIENVTKAERRGTHVDEAFVEKTFKDVISLYRLDQINASSVEKQDLGPLPATAVWLLVLLVLAWVGISIYFVIGYMRSRNEKGQNS